MRFTSCIRLRSRRRYSMMTRYFPTAILLIFLLLTVRLSMMILGYNQSPLEDHQYESITTILFRKTSLSPEPLGFPTRRQLILRFAIWPGYDDKGVYRDRADKSDNNGDSWASDEWGSDSRRCSGYRKCVARRSISLACTIISADEPAQEAEVADE